MSARLVLIVGSTALAECPVAMAELDCELQGLVQALAHQGGILVTSGSVGPEVMAEVMASTFGLRAIAYLRDGSRRQGRKVGRWHQEALVGSRGVSLRDHALIQRARMALEGGFAVEVRAFLDADATPHSSSQQRLKLAQAAGLSVVARVWRREGGIFLRQREALAA
jgi:hypothetical protein